MLFQAFFTHAILVKHTQKHFALVVLAEKIALYCKAKIKKMFEQTV